MLCERVNATSETLQWLSTPSVLPSYLREEPCLANTYSYLIAVLVVVAQKPSIQSDTRAKEHTALTGKKIREANEND